MILDFKDFEKLFEEINSHLDHKISLYVIGGAVMLYHGLKTATKDIDIIVYSEKEFKTIQNILKTLNFETQIPSKEYENFDLSQIFIKGTYRIDLFHKVVCKGFSLSDNMKKRADKILSLNKLDVYLCSTTDIFMFKTFTEREGDIIDCVALAQKEILWKKMLQEIKEQIKISKQKVWITYIGERMELLEEKNIVIPIMKDIYKIIDEFYDELEEKLQ
jgi:hypothetical protein